MAVSPKHVPDWWDREIDHEGRILRLDVREAVQEIWNTACCMAQRESIDIYDATVIMEGTVAQISNYVNNHPPPPGGHKIPALLMENFRKELGKYKDRNPVDLVDDPNGMDAYSAPRGWDAQIHYQLDYKALSSPLDDREIGILALREASGYSWDVIGEAFGISSSRAHHIYREAIRKMEARYKRPAPPRKPLQAGGPERE